MDNATFNWTQNLRIHVHFSCQIQGYTKALCLFVLDCLLNHERFAVALPAFAFGVWLNSSWRDSSSLAGRKEKITRPSILMFGLALTISLCVFCLLYSLDTDFDFLLPATFHTHPARDARRSFVSMLELSCLPRLFCLDPTSSCNSSSRYMWYMREGFLCFIFICVFFLFALIYGVV